MIPLLLESEACPSFPRSRRSLSYISPHLNTPLPFHKKDFLQSWHIIITLRTRSPVSSWRWKANEKRYNLELLEEAQAKLKKLNVRDKIA